MKGEGQVRLNIEALEFNWIFEGNNAADLIRLLAGLKSNTVFTKKSIKMFIDFMWNEYFWIAIVKKVFIPYVIYLILIINVCFWIGAIHLLHFMPGVFLCFGTLVFIYFGSNEIE